MMFLNYYSNLIRENLKERDASPGREFYIEKSFLP